MAGFDSSGSYKFSELESTDSNFLSPCFKIKVGSYAIDSTKIPVSSLQVQQTTQNKAGSCRFTVEALYNYETNEWADGFMDKVDVGMTVTVEAGYADSKKRIFMGFVDNFGIDYSSEGAPQLNVTAMDGMGLLMSNKEKKDFGKLTTTDVVNELVGLCTDEGAVESSDVDKLPSFEGQFVKEKECSSYDFLCRLAEMCFVSFCVIDGQLLFKNLMKTSKPIIELTMGQNLMSFSKSIAFSKNTVGTVTVLSNGTTEKKEVRGVATAPSSYGESGETGEEKWKALGGNNKDLTMNFLKTADECKTVAQNVLDSMSFGFVAGSGRCIGIPDIMAGRYIKIDGLDNKTNGSYFMTDVTHDFSGNGYYTEFTVKGFRSK